MTYTAIIEAVEAVSVEPFPDVGKLVASSSASFNKLELVSLVELSLVLQLKTNPPNAIPVPCCSAKPITKA